MSTLAGKHGLIVGVANKRSISWGIARAAAAAGARLALTYPSERLEENVRAADIQLTQQELDRIDSIVPSGAAAGSRYNEAMSKLLNG